MSNSHFSIKIMASKPYLDVCWKTLFRSVLFLLLQNALVFSQANFRVQFLLLIQFYQLFFSYGKFGVYGGLGSFVSTQYLKYSLSFIGSFPVHPNSSLLSFTLLLFLTLVSSPHLHFSLFLVLGSMVECLLSISSTKINPEVSPPPQRVLATRNYIEILKGNNY